MPRQTTLQRKLLSKQFDELFSKKPTMSNSEPAIISTKPNCSAANAVLIGAMPIAFDMLSIKNSNNAYVIHEGALRNFMHTDDKKDHVLKTAGINPEVPYITHSRRHVDNDSPGFGVILYKTREAISVPDEKTGNRSPMTYCLINFSMPDENHSYLVCRKGEVHRLYRYFKGRHKSKVLKFPPVLAPGLLRNIIDNTIGFLDKRAEYESYDVKPTRGILLHGKPGNGKTMVCKWLRTKCEQDQYYTTTTISPAQIDDAYNKGRLTSLVNDADIVFFDDMDLSFFTRRNDSGNPKLACALLAALDGVDDGGEPNVRIFTTNELIRDIDPAFRRPGRIDKLYAFHAPTPELRAALYKQHWHKDIQNNIDGDKLIAQTKDFSFAEFNEIRTLLVQNMLSTGSWDLDNALDAFKNRMLEDTKPKSFGFAAAAEPEEDEDDELDAVETTSAA